MRTTVVIPTYNEIDNIDRVCREVRRVVPGALILVVDDGSADGTADRAEQLGRELGSIDVLRRTTKDGLGRAYLDGLRRAIDDGAEVCVQMDADLSHDPEALPALIANIEHGADLAIGSRYVPGGRTINWSRRRRWLSRWGNRYAAGVLGLAIKWLLIRLQVLVLQVILVLVCKALRTAGVGQHLLQGHHVWGQPAKRLGHAMDLEAADDLRQRLIRSGIGIPDGRLGSPDSK